jgi:serine/threonine protein phosphatase PrpC
MNTDIVLNNPNRISNADQLCFTFNVPKEVDNGEDADPVLLLCNNRCFISVCDGMGGAGSSIYNCEGRNRTGAYLSSRIVNQSAKSFFQNIIEDDSFEINLNSNGDLKKRFINDLQNELLKHKKDSESKLKSKLLKQLPTTFSGLFIKQQNEQLIIDSIWVGDSRNFIYTKANGLQQLTKDDLKQEIDPYENLTKDSPLNNIISAEGDFQIRHRNFIVKTPCFFFTATDGCFSYFNTPMQFEFALCESISNANSIDDFKNNFEERVRQIAGDDFSMSFVAFGYNSFKEIKEDVDENLNGLYRDYHSQLETLDNRLNELQKNKERIEVDIKELEFTRHKEQKSKWDDYKIKYLEKISS